MERALQIVECPACLALKRPHIVCAEGHHACSACAARLASCPLCRGALLPAPVPNRALVALLQLAFPKVRACASPDCDHLVFTDEACAHAPRQCANEGCDVLVPPSDAEAHAATCAMRPERCAHAGCDATVGHALRHEHERACAHRLLRCAYCRERVPHMSMWFHLANAHGRETRVISAGIDVDFSTQVRWKNNENGNMLILVDHAKLQFVRVLPCVRNASEPCVVDVRVLGWDALEDEDESWDARHSSHAIDGVRAVYLRMFMAPGRCFSATARVGDTVSFALARGAARSLGINNENDSRNAVKMNVTLLSS